MGIAESFSELTNRLTKFGLGSSHDATNQQHRYKFQTEPVAHDDAIVRGENYRFTILTDGLIRLEWAEDGKFEDWASTFAINRKLAVPKFYLWEHKDHVKIVTSRFELYYKKGKLERDTLRVKLKGKVTGTWHYGDEIKDLGGTIRTLDSVNGRGDLGHGVLSTSGFGRIDDSKSFLFDKTGWISTRQEGDRSDEYLFCYGHDYKAAIRAFYALSGSQPLLPRYAFGNWWTRYHKYSAKEYLDLIDRFRTEDCPLSALVLDIYWHKVDLPPDWPGSGWTGFSWDRDLFPDPVGFLKKMKNKDLHLSLNNHPADGIRWFEDLYEQVAKAMGIDPASKKTIEFDSVDRKFMDAYLDIVCHQFEKEGIDFWWIDWQQGDQSKIPGIDPLWMLNHYHFLDSARNNKRPLILSRFAGPGSHRYQIGFSGDAVMTWESLDFQPEFTATASNIAYAWWSHDIGGHMGGYKDDELQTRWYQLGCWSPILRLHCNNNIMNFREPWKFNAEACEIMKDTLRMRHRLIPYLYTMNARSAMHDEPLIQPVYWEYTEEKWAYKYKNTYFFGTDFFLAPATSRRDTKTHLSKVNAWIPPNRWVDIYTGLVYDGDREMRLYRRLSEVPTLLREGSIVPLDGANPILNGTPNPRAIELILIVGADASFTLVEDDDSGSKVDDGDFTFISNPSSPSNTADSPDKVNFSTTTFTYTHETGTLFVSPVTPLSTSIPAYRSYTIHLLSHTPSSSPSHASLSSGRHIPITSTRTALGTRLTLSSEIRSSQSWTVELGESPELDVRDPEQRSWDILLNMDAEYDWKQDVWSALTEKGTVDERLERVKGRRVEGSLLGALVEIWTADGRLDKVPEGKDQAVEDAEEWE